MKHHTQPLLGIAIPTFNRAALLAKSFEHFSSWKLPFELTVSDNGSTDETPDVVTAFKDRLNIRYIRHPENRGPCPNILSAMHHLTTPYVLFTGDDDFPQEEGVKRAIAHMEDDPVLQAVYGTATYYEHVTNRFLFTDSGRPGELPERIHKENFLQLFQTKYVSEIFVGRCTPYLRLLPAEIGGHVCWGWDSVAEFLEHGDLLLVNDILQKKMIDTASFSYNNTDQERFYVEDFEFAFARLRKWWMRGEISQEPPIQALLNKILTSYRIGVESSADKLGNYLDSNKQIRRLFSWGAASRADRIKWNNKWLLGAVVEECGRTVSHFPGIDTALFQESELGTLCCGEFAKRFPRLNVGYLPSDGLLTYRRAENEHLFVDLFQTIQDRINRRTTGSNGIAERSLKDIHDSLILPKE